MADAQLVTMPLVAPNAPALGLSKDELHQLQQCEKIVRFRDTILAGGHPKSRVPGHLAKQTPPSSSSSKPSIAAKEPTGIAAQSGQLDQPAQIANPQSFACLPGLGNLPPTNATLPARHYGSGNTEINPIFLEKSDDLIKAELQLRRQRLERSLREEVDQRRASIKATTQSEPLADFDLSDVLSKALTLVQATTHLPANATRAANTSAASDSFDENSYYSSQHNSPDSSLRSSRAGNDDATTQAQKPSASNHLPDRQSQILQVSSGQASQPGLPSSLPHASATHQPQGQLPVSTPAPGRSAQAGVYAAQLNRYPSVGTTQRTEGGDNTGASMSGGGSGDASRSEESGVMDLDGSADRSDPAAGHQQPTGSLLSRQPSPLIQVRAQDISPIAPQPSHVSRLAMSGGRAPGAQDMSIPQGTTAQVAALRNLPNNISSPDSSPQQGGRNGEKRKGKKKKNMNNKRAARQAPEAEPYIKPEPRSPSPMNAPSFSRPQKQQRRQVDEEPRYAQPERQFSRSYRDEGPAPVYETQEYRPRPASAGQATVVASDYGYGREYVDEHRVSGGADYIRRAQSPVYAVRTAPSEIYATSPASVDHYGREPTRYYRNGYEVTRISTRPMADRGRSRSPVMKDRASPLMGPPKAPPPRVVIDPASGRRYYEPANVVRPSVAPPLRPGEPEIIYERAPVRAESRRPGPDPHAEDVLYQRTSPMYAAPRRVVTQPEYAMPDPHRVYRQREYSTRPMAPPGDEYVQVRSGTERRIVEEIPGEYMMRATTARPGEPVRYERLQSVRPEHIPVQEYAAPPPMHPDSRREVMQPGPRSYSVRPAAEPQVVRREYSVRPLEQQYYGQSVPGRAEAEVSYIERPRVAAPEVYYTGEGPRQIYR